MDDPVGLRRSGGKAVKVRQVAQVHFGTQTLDLHSSLIGTDETDDGVSRADQLRDEGGRDVPGRAGDENAHGQAPPPGLACCEARYFSACNQHRV
ncbi:hypothetical protein GCM10022380_52290 [Amycolatopsis tucumanensis]|uniref:Uncharacterized protein n=1 Tax=Amycolatopsis tucumanensis TaxID=401106 RepID=A0ABP7IUC9_9PSEU